MCTQILNTIRSIIKRKNGFLVPLSSTENTTHNAFSTFTASWPHISRQDPCKKLTRLKRCNSFLVFLQRRPRFLSAILDIFGDTSHSASTNFEGVLNLHTSSGGTDDLILYNIKLETRLWNKIPYIISYRAEKSVRRQFVGNSVRCYSPIKNWRWRKSSCITKNTY